MTGNAAFDRRIAEVAYAFGCGMSTTWWRSQHNKHHATTQKLGYDVDLDTLPLLAFNRCLLTAYSPRILDVRPPCAHFLGLASFFVTPTLKRT
jgi:hypothetical protein